MFGFKRLEERILAIANESMKNLAEVTRLSIKRIDARVTNSDSQLDRVRADLHERLTRIEVLLAEELGEKEKVRNKRIAERRAGRG